MRLRAMSIPQGAAKPYSRRPRTAEGPRLGIRCERRR